MNQCGNLCAFLKIKSFNNNIKTMLFQLPQESRGGGTVCTSGPILWGNFAHLIESVQTCN